MILVVAAGLRLRGIEFGLPYAYHADEPYYVSAALNLGAGIIGKQPYPTGFSNLLLVEYAAYFLSGWATGAFSSVRQFEAAYRNDPSVFLRLGRLTSAVFGVLTVICVYAIGRAFRGRLVGLGAALFVATAYLLVRDSHFGVPDIAVTFWVSVAVLANIVALRNGPSSRLVAIAAGATGLAFMTKWSAWPVVLVLGAAIAILWRRRGESPLRLSIASISGMFVGAGIGGAQMFLKPGIYLDQA
ncbi:MAG: glycosyltransferase family 39 protein, partial [Thermoflexales bacterium]